LISSISSLEEVTGNLGFGWCLSEGDVWSMALSLTRCLRLQERHQESNGLSKGSKRDKARVLACLGLAHSDVSRTCFR
jgi:hypothetical protein